MMPALTLIRLPHAKWLAEAERRYGTSLRNVRFKCPCCGFLQSGQDFIDLGMTPDDAASRVGFSCIGRWQQEPARDAFGEGPGPCSYAGGGLFRVSPIAVDVEGRDEPVYVFDFADEPLSAVL